MRRALPLPGSFILLLAAVACTMGALISGFAFTVNVGMMSLAWLVTAFALPALAAFKRGKGMLALLPPALALMLWKLPEITEGAKGVICYITSEYNKWLYIPVLFQGSRATVEEVTVFFTAAGIVLAFILYFAICLWRNSMLVVLLTAPIIFLTFVLIYNQPNTWYLVGLLAVYLTLLISNALSHDAEAKKTGSIFIAITSTVLLLAIAYFAVSPVNYNRGQIIYTLDGVIREAAEQVGIGRIKSGTGWPALSTDGVWRFDTERVGVADAGARNIADRKVLEITASEAGTFYLRGYSMQRFDGRTWSVNSDSLLSPTETLVKAMPAILLWEYGRTDPDNAPQMIEMTIAGAQSRNSSSREIVYSPYHSIPGRWTDGSFDYEFFYTEENIPELAGTLPEDGFNSADYFGEYNSLVRRSDMYTQIDAYTARGLRRLAAAAGIDAEADRAVIAEEVAAYISASGRYTLSPYVIPEGEDFALYFLENSKQGYCIHFATAATLMLRALDVPARLTSGFIVTVPAGSAGRTVAVTDRSAHAWVEVFFDNIGWLPLEVTPAGADNDVPYGGPYLGLNRPSGSAFEEEEDLYPDWYYDQLQQGRNPQVADDNAGAGARPQPGSMAQLIGMIAASCLIAAFAALIIRREIGRRRRYRRFAQEDANSAVIQIWRYMSRISRRVQPPPEYEALALRARFSQHRITEDERGHMIGCSKTLADDIYRQRNLFGRMWLKWGVLI